MTSIIIAIVATFFIVLFIYIAADDGSEGVSVGCMSSILILVGGLILSVIIWIIRRFIQVDFPKFDAPMGIIIVAVITIFCVASAKSGDIEHKSRKKERKRQEEAQRQLDYENKQHEKHLKKLHEHLANAQAHMPANILVLQLFELGLLRKNIQAKADCLNHKKEEQTGEFLQQLRDYRIGTPYPHFPNWPALLLAEIREPNTTIYDTLNNLIPALTYLPDLPPCACANKYTGFPGRNALPTDLKVLDETRQLSSQYYILLTMILAAQLQAAHEDGLMCKLYDHFMKLQAYNTHESVSVKTGSKHEQFLNLYVKTLSKWGQEFSSKNAPNYKEINQLPNTPYNQLERVNLPPDLFEPIVRSTREDE